jgi:hypothetical protein
LENVGVNLTPQIAAGNCQIVTGGDWRNANIKSGLKQASASGNFRNQDFQKYNIALRQSHEKPCCQQSCKCKNTGYQKELVASLPHCRVIFAPVRAHRKS